MFSNRIGFGSSINTPNTATLGQWPDLGAGVFVDAVVDELGQFVTVAPHAECSVAGVDQLDRGFHDGAQGGVEFQTRGHHQHGLDQAVESVAALDDLLDAILNFGEQFA